MADLQRIAVRIEADAAQFKRTLAESSQASRQFGANATGSFQKVSLGFKRILGIGGALGFAAIGAAALRASDQVSLGLRKIRVSSTGTAQDLKGLEQAFDNVFARVPQDATEVGSVISGLNTILKAEGSILEDLSRKVLDASRLMGEDGAQNATLFARAMNQFNERGERGSDILDALFNVSQRTGIGFSELLNLTNEYGSVLKNANFTIEESAELFGRLSSAGISVSRVSPGLNKAFRDWAAEGKNARTELQRIIDRMRNASSEAQALAIATETFGAEGAQRMTTAVRNGTFAVDDLSESFRNAKGAIEEANEATTTFAEEASELGNKILSALSPVGGFFTTLLRKINDTIDAIKDFPAVPEIRLEKLLADVTKLPIEVIRANRTAEELIDVFKRVHDTNIVPPSVKVLIGQLTRARQAAEELKQQQTLEEELFPTFPKPSSVRGGKDTSPRFSTDQLKEFDKIRKEEARKLEESLMKADQAQLETILEIENRILAEQSRNFLDTERIFSDLEQQTEAAERMKQIFGESFDETGAKADALRQALERLAATDIDLDDEQIQDLRTQLEQLDQSQSNVLGRFGSIFGDTARMIIRDARNIGDAFQTMGFRILETVTDIIIDQAINELTTALSNVGTSGATSSTGGLGDIFGGILSSIGGFFGLAEGGLVKQRGVFELAEDEPEFVIPVSKLPKFIERFQEQVQNAFAPAPSRFLDFPELAAPGFNLEPASFSPVSFPRVPEPTPDSMADLDRVVASVSLDGRGNDRRFDDGPGVKVNMTVVTPDANSFRRSQAQISSDLSRAVDRGMRGR